MPFDIVIGRKKSDVDKFGTAGAILIGKQYVKMGQITSLSNAVYMDVVTSHVVFVCGKRGGGKCLTGDTLITLNDGRQLPIKELENNDQEILCLNDSLKVQNSAKSDFFKRTVNRLLKVTLRTGKEIKLTPEHPLLTVKGWRPAEQLGVGRRIATPRVLPVFGERDLPEERVKLLAYLITEGHLSNGFVLFSNTDERIVSDFKQAVAGFDDVLTVNEHSKPDCFRVVDYTKKRNAQAAMRDAQGKFIQGSRFDSKNSLRKWLEELGLYGKLSKEKFISQIIFEAPKNKIALFLNRLFSCDGSIHKDGKRWRVSYCSISKQLIAQVQHLLLRFEILSRIRKKNVDGTEVYEIILEGVNVTHFLQEIGFYGTKEEKAVVSLREMPTKRNPNLDTIPVEIWESYRPSSWVKVGEALGYAHPKAARESMFYAPSRQKLLQIAQVDEKQELMLLANSDIYWDEIMNVEELLGEFEVYDISVPDYHNFVANDIIVHNSYTMGVVAEGVADMPVEVRQNVSVILLDTMGVYWTMRYPNFQDAKLLEEWGLAPRALDVKIFAPSGFYEDYKKKGIPVDAAFSIRPADLTPEDWCMTFNLDVNSPAGVLIARAVQSASAKSDMFSLSDLIAFTEKDERSDDHTKNLVISQFQKCMGWGIFSKQGTPLKDLAKGGQVTVLDMSGYATLPAGWLIKSLAVGLISKNLFNQRMIARKAEEFASIDASMHYFTKERPQKLDEPLVWLVLDEAHELLPRDGKTTATDALVTILREGRQPGISLILASQQPGKIHTDVMTQSDIVVSHRITAKLDTDALGQLTQSYLRTGLLDHVNTLPRTKGAAVVFDDVNERIFPIQVRPRFTWHGGGAPSALVQKPEFVSAKTASLE